MNEFRTDEEFFAALRGLVERSAPPAHTPLEGMKQMFCQPRPQNQRDPSDQRDAIREMNKPYRPNAVVLSDLERERIRAAICDTCAASLMSDTKWHKLFSVVATFPSIKHYLLKFIRDAAEIPGTGWLNGQAPHAFTDTLQFGPIYLREIEWLEFPALIPRRPSEAVQQADHFQDIEALERALSVIGKFPIERTPRGLRIVGHVRTVADRK